MPTTAKTKPVRHRKAAGATASALPRKFTVRDLSRKTAAVVASCRKLGSVTISGRDGSSMLLINQGRLDADGFPDWEARWKVMESFGATKANQADTDLMARMIAGEDVG